MRRAAALLAALAGLCACSGQSGQIDDFGGRGALAVPRRAGSVLAATCSLDDAQRTALASAEMKKVVGEVIVSCFDLDAQGNAQPVRAADRDAFALQTSWVVAQGYRVKVGVVVAPAGPGGSRAAGAMDGGLDDGARTDGAPLRDGGDAGDGGDEGGAGETRSLASALRRAAVVASVLPLAAYADGIELDVRGLSAADRAALPELIKQLAAVVRPNKTLGVMVPASAADPTNPRADVVDVTAFAGLVDRVRVLTLDYSGAGHPGPTIDSGWAVDSARALRAQAGATPIDVAMPLYGFQFGPTLAETIGSGAALALARAEGAPLARAPSGAPHFAYVDAARDAEEVWFDDAQSTVLTLAALQPSVLDPSVGVLFYGLGSEAPGLWPALVEATP